MSNINDTSAAKVHSENLEITFTNSIQEHQPQEQQQQFDGTNSVQSTLSGVAISEIEHIDSSASDSAAATRMLESSLSSPGQNSLATEVLESNGDGGIGLGINMMQSSPPPHSYRHSRAYRHFKNPPQPHMCIRTITESGEELFINVLSWTRIVIPQEPSDPIPLYGGMRVPPGNPRSPPIVFAVMANPEVLKDSGRHSKDPEERRAMVELMCDFVEAMNPGVKLVRNAVILKDRDISGELKDVWNAVQAQRDREREEQLMQQRQQQHYHNITTQQMFPKSSDAPRQENQMSSDEQISNKTLESDDTQTPDSEQLDNKLTAEEQQQQDSTVGRSSNHTIQNQNRNTDNAINIYADLSVSSQCDSLILQNGVIVSNDQIDASRNKVQNAKHDLATATAKTTTSLQSSFSSLPPPPLPSPLDNPTLTDNQKICISPTTSSTSTTNITLSSAVAAAAAAAPAPSATSGSLTQPTTTVTPVVTTPPTKKEKLAGFLPNGCIFPRFKNNKHKDKDKDKEKEYKSKDKEKTLLNVLKKSKDKKVAPSEQQIDKNAASTDSDAKSQYEKNCINLESEVQKLDLNKIDSNTSNDNMFIKLKVAATSAVAK